MSCPVLNCRALYRIEYGSYATIDLMLTEIEDA